jgi:uncharacterized membrane protein YcaP (DUF421 family)
MDKVFGVEWSTLLIPTYSILEMVLRGTLTYLLLLLILRFIASRQTGSIGLSDILVIVVIADVAQNAFSRQYESITEGAVLILTIVLWDRALDALAFHFPVIDRLIHPQPAILIRNGRLFRKMLEAHAITLDELHGQLREEGVEKVGDVRLATLESDGTISVVKKKPGG